MSFHDPDPRNMQADSASTYNYSSIRIVLAEPVGPDSTSQVFRVHTGWQRELNELSLSFVCSKRLAQTNVFLEFRSKDRKIVFEAANIVDVRRIDDNEWCCHAVFVRDECKVDRNWFD
jgi:hypothetical protein